RGFEQGLDSRLLHDVHRRARARRIPDASRARGGQGEGLPAARGWARRRARVRFRGQDLRSDGVERAQSQRFPWVLLAAWGLVLVPLLLLGSYAHARSTAVSFRLWAVGWAMLVAYWVHVDMRNTKHWPCFEYGAFVFWGWPIVLPLYLWQTRRRRALAVL